MNLISVRQRDNEHAFTHQLPYFVTNVTRRVKNQNWHNRPISKWHFPYFGYLRPVPFRQWSIL